MLLVCEPHGCIVVVLVFEWNLFTITTKGIQDKFFKH